MLDFMFLQFNTFSFVYHQSVFRIFKVFKSLRALRAIRVLRRLRSAGPWRPPWCGDSTGNRATGGGNQEISCDLFKGWEMRDEEAPGSSLLLISLLLSAQINRFPERAGRSQATGKMGGGVGNRLRTLSVLAAGQVPTPLIHSASLSTSAHSFLTSLQEVTGTLVRSLPSITAILILMFTCLCILCCGDRGGSLRGCGGRRGCCGGGAGPREPGLTLNSQSSSPWCSGLCSVNLTPSASRTSSPPSSPSSPCSPWTTGPSSTWTIGPRVGQAPGWVEGRGLAGGLGSPQGFSDPFCKAGLLVLAGRGVVRAVKELTAHVTPSFPGAWYIIPILMIYIIIQYFIFLK